VLRRRECQTIPIDVQTVFHLNTWTPAVLSTSNWLIRAPAALQDSEQAGVRIVGKSSRAPLHR
jgi:hypothetical protein